jgi:peptidoglycan/LPS O-acetylase OafA/YrhL
MIIKFKKNYLNYIQILRGISVLLIFLFHADLKNFSKGYLGVDIFFIISGYVITKILEEKFFYNHSYDFKNFYIKRILRIVPIYFFVITIFIGTFLVIGPLTDIDFILKKIIFIFTFASNFYYLNYQKEYFDNIFQDPLNHTWSLGVEMQFYFIFPFVLYFLKKNFNEKLITRILILIIVCGIALTYYYFLSKNINLVFYSPIFRSWEFLLGSLVYYIQNNKKFYKNYIIIQLSKASWMFLIIIIFTIFFSDENYKFLNLTLITISTSFFLLLRKNSLNKIFNNGPLLYLGSISYSFYLWHLPILFFFNVYFEERIKLIFAFIITVIFSHFSHIYIENKLKNLKINLNKKFLFLTTLIIILFFGSVKFYYYEIKNFLIANNYLEKKYSLTKRINYTEIKIDNNQIYPYCAPESKIYNKIVFDTLRNECLKFTNNKNLIYVEGDSHTAMFMPLILNSKNFENIYFINNTDYSYNEVNNQLKYFNKVIYVRSINNIDELNSFSEQISNFNYNINFLIFTPVPNYYNNKMIPVKCLIQNKNCFFDSEEDFRKRNLFNFNKKIKELKSNKISNNVIYFDPYKILCPFKNCDIYNTNNKILTYRDGNHITIEGSLLLNKDFEIFLIKNSQFFH